MEADVFDPDAMAECDPKIGEDTLGTGDERI